MEFKEINQLSKDMYDVIMQEELTIPELISLVALLNARINSRVYQVTASGVTTPPIGTGTAPSAPVVTAPRAVAEKKKGAVKYDPMYDPPPPFDPEPLPAPVQTGRIIAEKNHACVCDGCRKVIYVVNKDIYDSCKIPDFIASFTPSEGIEPMPKTTEVLNIDGKISCDCPQCGAVKALYLTGGR